MPNPLSFLLPRFVRQTAAAALCGSLGLAFQQVLARAAGLGGAAQGQPTITLLKSSSELRTYRLTTTAALRDQRPPDKQITFSETSGHAVIRTGNLLFDGLYALAVSQACANSVPEISDDAYDRGKPVRIEAFQTGELWKYVWTRDLAYSLHLGLAAFDPARAVNSLLFKSSGLKPSVVGGVSEQIVQDTGSGGSYPVSTDRVVWALGARETLKHLAGTERQNLLLKIYPILCGTIAQDRQLIFDPHDNLYRGEQSFLDWREQTYPGWTKSNVLPIAVSKALSVNAAYYTLLTDAAEYARQLNKPEEQARYTQWAADLRRAINSRFWDAKRGLYSTCLLSDDGVSDSVRTARYDLLGESLAILSGVADEQQASAILESYPTGPFGPSVVWPQERTVPIYHNQAIWPFVTAYWIKAARQVGNAAAVDAGVQSLEQLAASNLSNMENFDFVSGGTDVKSGPRKGPQVDSRRQLWSVAGYLSMVQDVVFGMETSWDGVRFRPFITAKLRNETFQGSDVIEWRNLVFQGTQNRVRVHLPPAGSFSQGCCTVERVELNGALFGADFVKTDDLHPTNEWNIYLQIPRETPSMAPLRFVNVDDERELCGPVQSNWSQVGQGGITVDGEHLRLHFEHADPVNVTSNVYRDGELCAEGIRGTSWLDLDSGDYRDVVHSYRVAAVDTHSGNVSHPTSARSYRLPDQTQIISAKSLDHSGGNLAGGHHFENWGQPKDELSTSATSVARTGTYLFRAEFSNGAGPVSTGIACGVKKLEVKNVKSGEIVASGYLVMPQSGDWKRYDLSSAVKMNLRVGEEYVFRIAEDEYCRNMSYLRSNERYTASSGGGAASYNYVNIAALHLLWVKTQQ